MIRDLLLHLCLVFGPGVSALAQDFDDDFFTTLVPIEGLVNLGVGALVNLLLDLKAIVNNHGFSAQRLHRWWSQRS